jgi:hypothetical protein
MDEGDNDQRGHDRIRVGRSTNGRKEQMVGGKMVVGTMVGGKMVEGKMVEGKMVVMTNSIEPKNGVMKFPCHLYQIDYRV